MGDSNPCRGPSRRRVALYQLYQLQYERRLTRFKTAPQAVLQLSDFERLFLARLAQTEREIL
jgi:hypothetical protein